MGRTGVLVAVLVAAASSTALADKAPHLDVAVAVQQASRPIPANPPASADPHDGHLEVALGERWHEVPRDHSLSLEDVVTDHLTDIGNLIGGGVGDLSKNIIGLKFDGRGQRAQIHLGNADGSYLHFAVDTDWHFTDGKARVATKLQLAIGQHHFKVELPAVDVEPTSVRGEDGVQLKIPILERRW